MAETYHTIDWRGLPLHTAAALAAGLPEEARVRRIIRSEILDRRQAERKQVGQGFATAEEFEAAYARVIGHVIGGEEA